MNPWFSLPMTVQGDYPDWFQTLLQNVSSALSLDISWADLGPLMLLIWSVVVFTLLAVLGQAAAIVMVLMERKVLAWLTQRKGPNRVGPWGSLQTLADGVKLLFKEDIIPQGANIFLFTIAPAVFFLPAFVFYALIPFTDKLLAVALPAGALFVFAISSISVVGLVLAGWASNNKYSLLGGMRSAAQAISYEIPLVLAILGVVLLTGSMNIGSIVQAQQGGFWNWFAIVLTPISLLIFFVSSLAEVNRVPFDLPEAESELVSGYNTEYTGMKFALFFLAEYAALFAMAGFTTAFFLGGYFSPLPHFLLEYITGQTLVENGLTAPRVQGPLLFAIQTEMLFWFMMKTYFFIFMAMWVRATLPRLKPDQLMGFSWKFLIPLSLINVFLIAIEKYLFVKDTPGQSILNLVAQGIPMLNPATWGNWVIFVITAILVFGGFFLMMSRLLTQKLEARLARR